MKIGIHYSSNSYGAGCIEYMKSNNLDYKVVNAYDSDIVEQLSDCDIFFWHHHHLNPKDILFAKSLLFSLEQSGKKVYPDYRSTWHFDDKVAQKYLLEALELPLINSHVFYTKKEALKWINNQSFPMVHKLKGGASSHNVSLVKNKVEARNKIRRAFGRGFRATNPRSVLLDDVNKLRTGNGSFVAIIKSLLHFVIPYNIEKSKGRDRGYAYFQDFIPNCNHDIRVQFIGDICYAMKRSIRENDFRASGANQIQYDGSRLPKEVIKLAFDISKKLKMQTLALDLIPDGNTWKIAEISYAFAIDDGECDFGFYTNDLIWHKGVFDPYEYMVTYLRTGSCISK
jgi:glutathione synthase/RimK-type ligase-like ATP-grasp enzyme